MNNYQTLLERATRLPAIAYTLNSDCDESEAIEILHRRFDDMISKLERFEREVLSLSHRPNFIIPFTGAVSGLVKHCQYLKSQRSSDRNKDIDYRYFIVAYKTVFDQLRVIAATAKKLSDVGPEVPPILADEIPYGLDETGLTVALE